MIRRTVRTKNPKRSLRRGKSEFAEKFHTSVTEEVELDKLFESYKRHADRLSHWNVGYVSAFLILLVSSDKLQDKLSHSDYGLGILMLFYIGLMMQVLPSVIYKATNYFGYLCGKYKSYTESVIYKFVVNFTGGIAFDLAIDLIAIFSLTSASLMLLLVMIEKL